MSGEGEIEQLRTLLRELSAEAPPEVDLTDPEHEAWVLSAAERIASVTPASVHIEALDRELGDPVVPVACGLAVKVALSRARVLELERTGRSSR